MTSHDNVTDIVEALHRHAFDDCGGFAGIIDNHVATEAAATIATLRKQLENAREWQINILAKQYAHWPVETAKLCDTELDRSGALLSHVRDAAREALKGQPC